uniref:hypothetical protein n=1 Tax=Salmonella sp. s51228 TaxID=3159652 RepID=UPI00397F43FB
DRIYHIISDLKLKHAVELDYPARQLHQHPHERPESLLEVTDSELKCDHYITEEEREKQTELAIIEEERKISELEDKWRDRGIGQMMGGKLEMDTEDELFKVSIYCLPLSAYCY